MTIRYVIVGLAAFAAFAAGAAQTRIAGRVVEKGRCVPAMGRLLLPLFF